MNPLVVRDHDNKGYITYAVDFDGCLCKSAYPVIGEPNHKLIGYLARERVRGNKVILWTARTGKSLQDAIDWCKEQGLVFDWINEGDPVTIKMYGDLDLPTRKVYADVYIDDRNIAINEIW